MKTATLALAALLLLGSCQSPKSKALMSLDRIFQHGAEAQELAVQVRPHVADEGVKPFEGMVSRVSSIMEEANGKARPAVEKLKNPEGWWSRVWGYVKWAVIGIVSLLALLVLGQWGGFPLLRGVVSWLARMGLPLLKGASADAAWVVEEMYERGANTPEYRKKVNKMRATNPSFDGAFIRAKQQYEAKAVKP